MNTHWTKTLVVSLIGIFLLGLWGYYFSAHLTIPPNGADEALLYDFLHMMLEGKRPYIDFIDVYGPLNWIFPHIAYQFAEEKIIGVRLWLWILKLLTLVSGYILVKELSNRFYGVVTVTFLGVFLGLPWELFQRPSSFFQTLPLIFLSTWILLGPAARNPRWLIAAGLLTSAVIWTKSNSGAFLLAGSLFYCFFWKPAPAQSVRQPTINFSMFTVFLQIIGLAVYGSIFLLYIQAHLNIMYGLYLLIPQIILLGLTLHHIGVEYRQRGYEQMVQKRFLHGMLYLSATVFSSFLVWILYYGWETGQQYLADFLKLIRLLDYHVAFPLLGIPGSYQSFNELYWPQLPWVVTALMMIWLILQSVITEYPLRHRYQWSIKKPQWVGLWGIGASTAYVMYSRSDEPHVVQAILMGLPMLGVLLFFLESVLSHLHLKTRSIYRGLCCIGLGGWLCTLINIPPWPIPMSQEWHSPRLAYLQVRKENDASRLFDHLNQASAYIAQKLPPENVVLVLSPYQLLNLNSHTIPIGGRYRYFFYLIHNELLSRQDFDHLVPPSVIQDILKHPPLIAVDDSSPSVLLREFPELKELLKQQYRLTQAFGSFRVYEYHDALNPPIVSNE